MRSAGLAVLGAGLLAAAAVLGALLVHDGEAERPPLAGAEPGDAVALKGTPLPFYPTQSLAHWGEVLPLLANHTYVLDAPDGTVALLTSESEAPSATVLADGTVAFVGAHPDGSGRPLVVVRVAEWREPLVFR